MSVSLRKPDFTEKMGAVRAVTIVVPCFNEQPSIRQLHTTLYELVEWLAPECDVHFVFVDDGSADETVSEIRGTFGDDGPRMKLVRHGTNRGIAAAISTGIHAAETEIVCSIDSDGTYDPMQVVDMLQRLESDVDVVVASPYHPEGRVENISNWRLALSRSASRMYRRLFRNKLHTYTSCFRLYRRSVVNRWRPTQPGFVGVVELLWMLDQGGRRIVECPTRLTSRVVGQSKMRVVSVAWSHFMLMLRIVTKMQADGRVADPSPIPVSSEEAH